MKMKIDSRLNLYLDGTKSVPLGTLKPYSSYPIKNGERIIPKKDVVWLEPRGKYQFVYSFECRGGHQHNIYGDRSGVNSIFESVRKRRGFDCVKCRESQVGFVDVFDKDGNLWLQIKERRLM